MVTQPPGDPPGADGSSELRPDPRTHRSRPGLDEVETQALPQQPIRQPRRPLRAGLLWSALALFLALIIAGTFVARAAHRPLLAPTATSDPNVSGGMLLAFPNPVPAGQGDGTTAIAWIAPNSATGQVWVSINGAPEILFAQGGSGAQFAPWIRHSDIDVFRLYSGIAHTGAPLKSVTVTRE